MADRPSCYDYIFAHRTPTGIRVGRKRTKKTRTENMTDITTALKLDDHNRAVEAAELAQWAERPERFSAYVDDNHITTWLGTVLGRIVRQSDYRNNFRSQITCLTIVGTNGSVYYGRYGADWSQLIRLRKAVRT